MSSMRNAVQRRQHKERAQPLEREKWGLLEKRKDYKLRAADFREKKQKLRNLSQIAADRNPDEFSFRMLNSKMDASGKKVGDRGNKALNHEVVQKLKTQDAAYLRTMLQQTRKERRQLEDEFRLDGGEITALRDGGDGEDATRTTFVGDKEEQKRFKANSSAKEGGESLEIESEEEEEDRPQNKRISRKQKEEQENADREQRNLIRRREKAQERRAAHLEAVKAREQDLMAAEEELEKQRARMSGTVGGVNKHGVKFKIRERKR